MYIACIYVTQYQITCACLFCIELQDALESTNSGIQQPITPNGIVSTLGMYMDNS